MDGLNVTGDLNVNLGTCGKFVKVRRENEDLHAQEICCLKFTPSLQEKILEEVKALRDLVHPNIVRHEGYIFDEEKLILYVLTEHHEWKSLQSYQNSRDSFIPEDFLWTVAQQLIPALQYLHSSRTSHANQILHGNIKPESILVSHDWSTFKLGGLSYGVSPVKYYCPCPELLQGQTYSSKSDVWFLGCVIYGLCIQRTPFEGLSSQDISAISQVKRLGTALKDYSQDLRTLLSLMLTPTPELRPSALMLQHHPLLHTDRSSKKPAKPAVVSGKPSLSDTLLETEFPHTARNTHNDDLDFSLNDTLSTVAHDLMNSTESSINHYLSILGGKADDSLDFDSPTGDSSSFPLGNDTINLFSGLRLSEALPKASSVDSRLQLLEKKELALKQWSQMLAEKEQELLHKEKRLALWESCLKDLSSKADCSKTLTGSVVMGKESIDTLSEIGRPISSSPILEHTVLESDLETTVSADPGDLSIRPTATKLEPSKIKNPFSPYDPSRRIKFDPARVFGKQAPVLRETGKRGFTEQRTSWLANKRQQHHLKMRPSDYDPEFLGAMEEKTLKTAADALHKKRDKQEKRSIKLGKENLTEQEFWQRTKQTRVSGSYDRPVIPEEIREKLKAQNLPGFRC